MPFRANCKMATYNFSKSSLFSGCSLLKGKKWGLAGGRGLVRVFRNPLKRIILPLIKAGHMQTLVVERWSFERTVSSKVKFTTCFRVFTFENQSFLQHVTCRSPLRRNAVWKQGRTGLSQEGQWEGQELDIRMCCHHIKSEPRTKTFMLHARPRPLCVTQWWNNYHLTVVLTTPQKAILSGYLVGFRVGALYILVTWKRLWVIRDTILFQVYVHTLHQVAS